MTEFIKDPVQRGPRRLFFASRRRGGAGPAAPARPAAPRGSARRQWPRAGGRRGPAGRPPGWLVGAAHVLAPGRGRGRGPLTALCRGAAVLPARAGPAAHSLTRRPLLLRQAARPPEEARPRGRAPTPAGRAPQPQPRAPGRGQANTETATQTPFKQRKVLGSRMTSLGEHTAHDRIGHLECCARAEGRQLKPSDRPDTQKWAPGSSFPATPSVLWARTKVLPVVSSGGLTKASGAGSSGPRPQEATEEEDRKQLRFEVPSRLDSSVGKEKD